MRLASTRGNGRGLLEGTQLAALATSTLLVAIGVLLIYSAAAGSRFTAIASHPWRQLAWLGFAALAMLATMAIPFSVYDGFRAYVGWGLSLVLLVLVLVVGTSGLGAQRWLMIGGLRLQPSELAKLTTIVALARYLSGRRRDLGRLRSLGVPALLAGVPTLLVLQQPDLGTALVFPAILLGMLYWAGLPFLYLLLLVSPVISLVAAASWLAWGIFALAFVLILYWSLIRLRLSWLMLILLVILNLAVGIATPKIWGSLQEYQRQRITAFLNPARDRYGSGYQIIQSEIAIGSGGLLGQGYLQGTQKNFQFLPEKHTDFVFSVAGEEFGLAGCSLILLLYLVVLLAGIDIASRARSRFASLVAFGVIVVIGFHVVVNISMTVGLAPVTGLPLPLLSYGGSSLVTSLAGLGLVIGIGTRRHEY